MLALVATFVFAAAATFAVAVVFVTMSGRLSQIATLLADHRSLQRDREFLVTVTTIERPALRTGSEQQIRRTARRALKRADSARCAHSLRAAA
ncbi:hypothetical protein [Novosphingobium sp. AAP83]|uniref:hypothetical protein n=1 Tax=Novosphingobium sp. AAP83 TaxID=1523425 RepID=UPI0012FB20AF|nr:hypothetical protein [Novosphingobium sp. AAP83]